MSSSKCDAPGCSEEAALVLEHRESKYNYCNRHGKNTQIEFPSSEVVGAL